MDSSFSTYLERLVSRRNLTDQIHLLSFFSSSASLSGGSSCRSILTPPIRFSIDFDTLVHMPSSQNHQSQCRQSSTAATSRPSTGPASPTGKTFPCPGCGFDCRSANNKARHMREVHPDESVSPPPEIRCDICGQTFTRIGSLHRHVAGEVCTNNPGLPPRRTAKKLKRPSGRREQASQLSTASRILPNPPTSTISSQASSSHTSDSFAHAYPPWTPAVPFDLPPASLPIPYSPSMPSSASADFSPWVTGGPHYTDDGHESRDYPDLSFDAISQYALFSYNISPPQPIHDGPMFLSGPQ